MKAIDFSFHLPQSLIALEPSTPRDNSRLLVLHKDNTMEHRRFSDLPEYLNKGDMLVLNNTRVFPARLTGKKQTGGKIEMLMVKKTGADKWDILSGQRYTGKVFISDIISGEVVNGRAIKFNGARDAKKGFSGDMNALWEIGQMPLPPYIKRKPVDADKSWYQTVYAEKTGSIAAPTAGLHFTKELMSKLEEKGVLAGFVTLHIGTGTFKPIRTEDLKDHIMDSEHFEIEASLFEALKEVKKAGKRVIAVGTTTTRALEGYASGRFNDNEGYGIRSSKSEAASSLIQGTTDIFIHPGYKFKIADSLITNFHLPASTPLMLASALGSPENIMNAYNIAVSMKYRFFSYGDAMLIL